MGKKKRKKHTKTRDGEESKVRASSQEGGMRREGRPLLVVFGYQIETFQGFSQVRSNLTGRVGSGQLTQPDPTRDILEAC